MVEADDRVVLPGDHVVEVARVDGEPLLGLPPQRAVLVHSGVLHPVPAELVRAAEGIVAGDVMNAAAAASATGLSLL